MWKRVAVLWTVVRGDAVLLWRAVCHPRAPRWVKLGAAGIVLYLFSPIDLIPDLIPVFGVMDDIILIPLAIRWLLRRLPGDIRADIARPDGFDASSSASAQARREAARTIDSPRAGSSR